MALYEKVINLISRCPNDRTTMECQELVDWLKAKSEMFNSVKYGKQFLLIVCCPFCFISMVITVSPAEHFSDC